mmetsp:Transcript_36627/g.68265  ORF Transcript_36627/g.68265 Transcript_36627/m.68265 type:complete len:436 (-) Transcript_36627:116-1423(-)
MTVDEDQVSSAISAMTMRADSVSSDPHEGMLEMPHPTAFPHLLGKQISPKAANSTQGSGQPGPWKPPADWSLVWHPHPTPFPELAGPKLAWTNAPAFVPSAAVRPGDVLYIRGGGAAGTPLANLGTLGGLFGHVLLALEAPMRISRDSDEGEELRVVWPSADVNELWLVRALECNRSKPGLNEANILLYVSPTGGLRIAGEVENDYDLDSTLELAICDEHVELWKSPTEVRHLNAQLFDEVVEEMQQQTASWSWSTATYALVSSVQSARMATNENLTEGEKSKLENDILQSWQAAPICTSVVVGFWQRYLWKLAQGTTDKEPLDLMLKWMPVRADRVLPGPMLKVMDQCGWKQIAPERSPAVLPKRTGRVKDLVNQWNGLVPCRPQQHPEKQMPQRHPEKATWGGDNDEIPEEGSVKNMLDTVHEVPKQRLVFKF